MTVPTERLWFGNILDWTPSEGGYAVCYHARNYAIVPTRGDATTGTRPGWRLNRHPLSPYGSGRPGPDLGGDLTQARRLAEAWLIADPTDLRPAEGDGVADLISVLLGGATFGPRQGELARPDHERGVIYLYDSMGGDPVKWRYLGDVAPSFHLVANPAVRPILLGWVLPGKSRSGGTWKQACGSFFRGDWHPGGKSINWA